MTPSFAASALMSGHEDFVRIAIQDFTDEADKAFFLLKLSEEFGRLMQDRKAADKVLRRLK